MMGGTKYSEVCDGSDSQGARPNYGTLSVLLLICKWLNLLRRREGSPLKR